MTHLSIRAAAATALVGVGLVGPAQADYAGSLEEARDMSAETGLPILLDVGTEW